MGGRGGASHRGTAGHFGRDPLLQGFRDFSDTLSTYNWHEQNNFDWDRWNQLMSDAERNGIYAYTGSLYDAMNRVLRKNENEGAYVQRQIDNAKAGLSKWVTMDEFVVYRGAYPGPTASLLGGTKDQLSDANFLRSRIGKNVTDKGFMSSAVHESDAWTGSSKVTYKIYVNKGVSGMYVDLVSANRTEREFLFNAGTQFVVHEIKTDASGRITSMTLEAMPVRKRRR